MTAAIGNDMYILAHGSISEAGSGICNACSCEIGVLMEWLMGRGSSNHLCNRVLHCWVLLSSGMVLNLWYGSSEHNGKQLCCEWD